MGVFIWSVGVTVWQQFPPHHHTDIYKMMNESSYEDHHTSERKKKTITPSRAQIWSCGENKRLH